MSGCFISCLKRPQPQSPKGTAAPLAAALLPSSLLPIPMQKHPCMKNINQTVALHMAERLPLLSHTPARTLRRPYTLAVALTLAFIALSLLAVDARSGFAFSTSLRGSIVSFPNGDLKTITVIFYYGQHIVVLLSLLRTHSVQDMIHRASLGNFTAPSMKPGGCTLFLNRA